MQYISRGAIMTDQVPSSFKYEGLLQVILYLRNLSHLSKGY